MNKEVKDLEVVKDLEELLDLWKRLTPMEQERAKGYMDCLPETRKTAQKRDNKGKDRAEEIGSQDILSPMVYCRSDSGRGEWSANLVVLKNKP